MGGLIKLISFLLTLLMILNSGSFGIGVKIPADFSADYAYEEVPAAVENAEGNTLAVCPDAVLVYTENKYEIVSSFTKNISLPVVVLYSPGSEDAAAKINADLKSIYDSACSTANTDATYSSPNGFYDFCISAISVSGCILSITFDETAYTGGARPMHSTGSVQYDLVTGERFSVNNIIAGLDDTKKSQFESVLLSALIPYDSKFMSGAASVASGVISYSSGNWSISSEGLTITFNPGDVAPYSEGYISATLSPDSLEGIVSREYFTEPDKSGSGTVTLCDVRPDDLDMPQYGPETPCCLLIDGEVYDLKETHAGGIYLYLSHGCDGIVALVEENVGILDASWYSDGTIQQLDAE